MLRYLKPRYGDKVGTLDGEIGHVKDFNFDDQSWAVHSWSRTRDLAG